MILRYVAELIERSRHFDGAQELQPERQARRVDAHASDGWTGERLLLIPGSNGDLSTWDSPWFSLSVTNAAIYERDDAPAWVISTSEALAVPFSLKSSTASQCQVVIRR